MSGQIISGCILIGIGTILPVVAGIHQARAERAAASRNASERKKVYGHRSRFLIAATCGALLTALGTGLTLQGSEEDSKKILIQLQGQKTINTNILAELEEQKVANTNLFQKFQEQQQEFREKIQTVLIQLNAAKTEDSKKITEEKVRVIQKDFLDWAEYFSKNRQKIKSEYDKTISDFEHNQLQEQIDEVKDQVLISQQSYDIIYFVRRFVENMVSAYGKTSGKDVKIDQTELPQNFYEKVHEYPMHIDTNTIWTIVLLAYKPGMPCIQIKFANSNKVESAILSVSVDPKRKVYGISYKPTVPVPDPSKINGEHDFADYETIIRELFPRVIETQLMQTVE